MSLFNDIRETNARPQALRDFGESHPVLLTLAAAAAFLTAFALVSRYLFLVF